MTTRRQDDHVHPHYWTVSDHDRWERGVQKELEKLREDLEALTIRVTLMMGGLAIMAVLLPFIAPILRVLFGVDNPEVR